MTICHIISMNDINVMGEITRTIYNECVGKHIWHHIDNENTPQADIYILHCFKNQKYFPKFINWMPLSKPCKIISLIHSSEPCMPNKNSDIVVTITKTWQERMRKLYNVDSLLIYPGIDVEKFGTAKIDYSKQSFGKITRPEVGKFHTEWDNIITDVFEANEKVECIIACDGYEKLKLPEHKELKWVEGIKINEIDKKIKFFEGLSVYTECHSDSGTAFIDTFCIAMLEGMASGLPVIIYKGLQEPMAEVIGGNGIICNSLEEYKDELNKLLNNEERRILYGSMAKARSMNFTKTRMVGEWNKLIQSVL